jgi:hypothetical protein
VIQGWQKQPEREKKTCINPKFRTICILCTILRRKKQGI